MRMPAAEAALVALAAHMAINMPKGEDFNLWLSLLDEVLYGLDDVSPGLLAIKVSAAALVAAEDDRARGMAKTRLRIEVGTYYRAVAAARTDSLRRLRRGVGS